MQTLSDRFFQTHVCISFLSHGVQCVGVLLCFFLDFFICLLHLIIRRPAQALYAWAVAPLLRRYRPRVDAALARRALA